MDMRAGFEAEKGEVLIGSRFALFDRDGRLAQDCAELWTVIQGNAREIAQAFWTQYARSSEVGDIAADKQEELVARILP